MAVMVRRLSGGGSNIGQSKFFVGTMDVPRPIRVRPYLCLNANCGVYFILSKTLLSHIFLQFY